MCSGRFLSEVEVWRNAGVHFISWRSHASVDILCQTPHQLSCYLRHARHEFFETRLYNFEIESLVYTWVQATTDYSLLTWLSTNTLPEVMLHDVQLCASCYLRNAR